VIAFINHHFNSIYFIVGFWLVKNRHALKEDFSNYRSNIIVQNGNSEAAVKAAQALANKHHQG
jgi:accessory colonization factor AcfC